MITRKESISTAGIIDRLKETAVQQTLKKKVHSYRA